MQLHELTRRNANSDKKRVARGGKRGKTAGRGMKGQRARAGGTPRPVIRDIIKKVPKLRGHMAQDPKTRVQPVHVGDIEARFSSGAEITPAALRTKGLVRRGGTLPTVKILADGEITKPVTIKGCKVSGAARQKLAQAGATVIE